MYLVGFQNYSQWQPFRAQPRPKVLKEVKQTKEEAEALGADLRKDGYLACVTPVSSKQNKPQPNEDFERLRKRWKLAD